MIKVVFCLPGESFSCHFLEAWTNLLLRCNSFGVEPILRWAYVSNVYQVRSLCLMGKPQLGINQKPFQGKIDYDYIMWIDSDSIFTPDQFTGLLEQMEQNRDLHILSGLYYREGKKDFAAAFVWKNSYLEKHGKVKYLKPKDLKGKKGLIEVEFTGMGFMLVRKGVFESLKYPWFQPLAIRGTGGFASFTSEDIAFCSRAKEKGFFTYLDPKILIGHEKSVILR